LALEQRQFRHRPSAEKKEEIEILARLRGMKSNLEDDQVKIPKRQAQRLRKEYQVLELYYLKNVKRG
jgi:hypothetical protein